MDFIITWVDGSDQEWQKNYRTYKKKEKGETDTDIARFRDWENLHFWFRGIEKFAPWVDKIHFVTWGHLPEWLNTNHPKLHIVNHRDYIPEKYLPTFSSIAIELNFHRIKNLSEEFVYFNDDTFLINSMAEKHFFKNGKPCDFGVFDVLTGWNYNYTLLKNLSVINTHFSKRKTIREKPTHWFNIQYGLYNFSNLFLSLLKKKRFTGFYNPHLPQPVLKKTVSELWEKEGPLLDEACRPPFRDYRTVNLYLWRYWNLASNNFHPVNSTKLGKELPLHQMEVAEAEKIIRKQKYAMVCLNDHVNIKPEDFRRMKNRLKAAFETLLPDKSSFER